MATNGKEIDVTIGGVDFRLATASDLPESFETIPIRKEQLDVEPEPGEQSLSQWWRRSQDSFHHGAGWLWAEGSNDGPHYGFWSSAGLDPFSEPGQMTMLRETVQGSSSAYTIIKVGTFKDAAGVEKVFILTATDVYILSDPSTSPSSWTTTTFPVVSSTRDVYLAGDYAWYTTSGGDLIRRVISAGTTTTWPLTSASGVTTGPVVGWGKHRLWACGGRYIWQPNTTSANGTAQAPIFTHPNESWKYTCLAEGPQAMYFGGHDGLNSVIQAVALDAGGGIPTLSGAQITVSLPPGELITHMAVLANQYIGIGTNKGFRVGMFDGVNITYGPLILHEGLTNDRFNMDAPLDAFNTCGGVVPFDKYFMVSLYTNGGVTGNVCRVDTSTELQAGVFPWSRDTSTVERSICLFGGRRVGIRATNGSSAALNYEHATNRAAGAYGTVWFSRVRFRTHENKIFHRLEADVEFADTTDKIDFGYNQAGGVTWSSSAAQTLSLQLSQINPTPSLGFRINLTRSTSDPSSGPTLRSAVVKALPSVAPQRLITLPLLCYDREVARSGKEYGKNGFAMSRLNALKLLEDAGDVTTYTDHRDGSTHSVVFESLRFIQQATGRHPGTSGKGGILIAQLRTMDE